ncbi:MAG: multidrug effflux MFS transporter [Brevundimonas sp.]|nr:multidrug effflux MFS transporter [Brevundimonas sp.]
MSDNRPIWAHALPTAILLMAPFDLLASLAMDIYLPVTPAMPAALQADPPVIQLTLSVYLLGLGLGQVIFGPLSDRFGRRPVLLSGALTFAVTSGLLAMAASGWAFVVLRLAQAMGAAAMLVATFATVRDVYGDKPESVRIYGLFSAMLAFVPAFGPVLGALVSAQLSWRAIFWFLAALTLPPLMHALWRWTETRPLGEVSRPRPGPILRSRAFQIYTLAFGAAMGSFFVYLSTAPRILVERVGLSGLEFSLAFASTAFVMIVASHAARPCLDRWGVAGAVQRGMGLLLASALCFGASAAFGEASIGSVILPSWIMAVGIVLTVSVSANGALKAFGDQAGLAVALYFAGQSLIVSLVGTLAVILFNGSTVWPLAAYTLTLPTLVLLGLNASRKS